MERLDQAIRAGFVIGDALGYYEKRDCPGSRFECRGSVRMSADGERFIFTPHDKNLRPVEAVPGSDLVSLGELSTNT